MKHLICLLLSFIHWDAGEAQQITTSGDSSFNVTLISPDTSHIKIYPESPFLKTFNFNGVGGDYGTVYVLRKTDNYTLYPYIKQLLLKNKGRYELELGEYILISDYFSVVDPFFWDGDTCLEKHRPSNWLYVSAESGADIYFEKHSRPHWYEDLAAEREIYVKKSKESSFCIDTAVGFIHRIKKSFLTEKYDTVGPLWRLVSDTAAGHWNPASAMQVWEIRKAIPSVKSINDEKMRLYNDWRHFAWLDSNKKPLKLAVWAAKIEK